MIDLDTLVRKADPARDLAVPEVDPAEIGRLAGRPPRARRRLIDGAAFVAAAAVAVGVALIVLLAGHNRATVPTGGSSATPAATRALTRILAVLRRPQTSADRAMESIFHPGMFQGENPDLSLVRLAVVTPWGDKVVLAPENGHSHGTLGIYLVSSSGSSGSRATANQIQAGHAWTGVGPTSGPSGHWRGIRLIAVVPDGVAKVAFLLAPEPRFGSTAHAPVRASTATVPVHNNIASVQVNQYCCGDFPVMRWYAPDGRVIKVTGDPTGSVQKPSAPGGPAINLPPGVVTVAQLREPDGTPFRLTLQRIRFERRQYVCLAVTQGPGTSQECKGPLPLPDRPLVAVMGDPTVCKPHPAQLVWGLALTNVSVALRSGGREYVATRRSIPAELRARGNVFYVWARSAPASLLARTASGKTVETYPINTASVPVVAALCKHQPTSGQGSTLTQSQTNQP